MAIDFIPLVSFVVVTTFTPGPNNISSASMGPELQYETVEKSPDRVVVRITECPWWNRQQEQNVVLEGCDAGHVAFCNAFAGSVNPKVTMRMNKSRHRGDSYCEEVYEMQE